MIIHNMEQGTDEWYQVRCGIPTASEFSKLITSKGEPSKSLGKYAYLLAAEKYANKPLDGWEGNQWTERGKLLEADARELYAFQYDVEPEQIGFVTDDQKRYGCSPDSLVGDKGLLEIKCLKAENHAEALVYYKKNKKCPTTYVQQTQGQILVCEREWCDLFFYHPDLPHLTIRQERNDEFIKKLQNQIALVEQERDKVYQILQEAV